MKKNNVFKAGVLSVAASTAIFTAVATPILTSPTAHAASSYVTLDTFSGKPASTLTISGGNYTAGETVAITIVANGSQISAKNATASAGGEFSTTVTLPAKLSQGSAMITATGLTSGHSASNSYYVSPFTPSLTTSAGASDPYAPLTVSGTGYAPNEMVNFNFAGSTASVTANASGAFTNFTITTPSVPAAAYTLVGTGEASGASAIAYQYVNSFYSSAAPTSYYVLPATSLGFNGSGFAAGEKITVTDAKDGAVLSTFTAGADGSFTNGGAFIVPAAFAGLEKQFVLTGSKSKAVATTSSTIGKYFPSVSPFVYYTMPGTVVGFNGSGFVPGETISIMNGTVVVGTVKADSFGKISNAGNVLIPLETAGTTQTYSLIGETSKGMGSASIQIGSYSPQVSPSTYYATPGSIVTFTGSGYAPGETVSIFKGNKVVGTFTVGADGSFSNAGGVVVAYNQANTSASYILLGSISKTPQMISFGVGTLSTQVTPSSYYVLPFELFSVTVSGFAPNEIVNLMSGTSVLATATTNAKGIATFTSVSLPAGTSSAQLLIIGMTSQATGSVSIGIGSYYASIGADNYYVKPGTDVTLNGNGFAANETITITAGNHSISTTADKNGSFTTLFTVPFGETTGSITVSAAGSKSTAVAVTTLTLAPYTPTVSPSTYYGLPGSDVVFTGSGYVAGEMISISFQGQVRGVETADSKGNFVSKTYALPYGKVADYTLTSNISNVSTDVIVGLADFYAGVQLDNYYGVGGTIVTVSGTGFASNETVTITAGDKVIGNAQADKNGAFTLKVAMPYAKAGELVITALGDESNAISTSGFTVAQSYTATQLETYAVEAGKAVTVIGSGYFAGEPITISNKANTSSVTIYAKADGTVNDASFVIPESTTPGEMTIVIKGTYSHTVSEITIYVLPSRRTA